MRMSEMEMEILQGAIAGVVFQNYDNGYAVLRLKCDSGDTVTVVGTVPLPIVGERLMVTGKWSSHASYGRQFEAEFLERLLPQSTGEILRYLSSRAIKGIGPKLAAKIVEKFGESTLLVMEREPERLSQISGISEIKAKSIGEEFRMRMGMRHLLEFFSLHQLPTELAVKFYKIYGDSSMDLLYDDPYMLMEEGLDAPFGAVDRFAIEMGISGDDPRRLEAGILFELSYNLNMGHSFLTEEKLIEASGQLMSVDKEVIRESVDRLVGNERIVRDTLSGITVDYLPLLYRGEVACTRRLLELADSSFPPPASLEAMLKTAASGIRYSKQQEMAIRSSATTGLLLVTGGPGTGKTTILNGVLSLYEQMGLRCVLAAPTGRAAKRLTEVTGRDASTIHRLLEAGVEPRTGNLFFARDNSNPLKADAVIVDEMSMVDILLLYHLLDALPDKVRVVLVGDPDQLPPVGPGFPFSDMLRSGILPSVRLTEIFRQAQESLIVRNAHSVNRGEMPQFRNVKSDFFFLPARSEEDVAQTIADLCKTRLPQRMGIPSEQIQVLSPTKKGVAGTILLNRKLQSTLNPPDPEKREYKLGDTVYREGDRVIQIRNNYDIVWKKTDSTMVGTGVFNGDIGVIRAIDRQMETLTVVFDDREVEYDFMQLNELELAYALTVHKSQGSEYRAVILSAWSGSGYLLNRSILYTAITRAKELLIISGLEQTVAAMVNNGKVGRRYSGLKLRLQGKTV